MRRVRSAAYGPAVKIEWHAPPPPGRARVIGPLSDLTASGMAIPQTLAAGMSIGTPTLVAATHLMLGAVARSVARHLPAGVRVVRHGRMRGARIAFPAPPLSVHPCRPPGAA